jgi:hypothetical protein
MSDETKTANGDGKLGELTPEEARQAVVNIHIAHNLASGRTDIETDTHRFDLICAALGNAVATIMLRSRSVGESSPILRPPPGARVR